MLVLLLGHRLGITKAFDKLKIPYLLWAIQQPKNKLNSLKVITGDFPKTKEQFNKHIDLSFEITHVIAGSEGAVIPASHIRRWLDLKRNPHSVILKCTDKFKMKEYIQEKGVPITKFLSSKDQTAESIIKELGLPVVCKVKLSSGGRGIEFLKTKEDIKKHIKRDVYFEKAIKGKEGSIESFIVNKEIIFSSLTEYHINGQCNKIPASYSQEIKDKILKLNSQVIKSLNIKWGLTHLEYYLTDQGIVFGEVALRPPGGYIMETLEYVYGQKFWEHFVKVEVGIPNIEFNQQQNFCASLIIHPGEGIIEKIEGLEKVKELKSFQKIKLNLDVGDTVEKRDGVGQDYGHAYFSHHNQEQLNNDVDYFYKNFRILMK